MKVLFQINKYNQQRQREKARWIYPVLLASYATYLRNKGHDVVWDREPDNTYDQIISHESQIDVPYLSLPYPDRILTKALDPKWQDNGNFKYHPGTYIMASSSCWWKKCTFCVEKDAPENQLRTVESVIHELHECSILGFKEVFDDSGTFPDGHWLDRFCIKKITHGDLHKLPIGCNMRIGAKCDFRLMKRAGFRMILFGIESANQETLDRIQKGVKADDIIPTIKQAKEAGLDPHIAVMFGYSWEKDSDAANTLQLLHYLLRKGYATTAQASVYCVKDEEPSKDARKYVQKIYEAVYSPEFWFNKIKECKNIEDYKFLWKQIKAGLNRG